MAKSRASELDIPRLCQSVYSARLTLKRYREEMREMIRESVGRHWSDEGTPYSVPLNLISTYQSIMSRRLVPGNPRAMLSTWDKKSKAAVAAMESWVNPEIENMHFGETLRRIVTSSLFSVGIGKVSLAMPADSAHKNWNLAVGQPYYDEVLLDDAVWDVHAARVEECGYQGHQYRVPIDVVKDSKLYTKVRNRLQPSPNPQFNREGDERLGVMGRSYYSDREEYDDFVTLHEIYLPRHRLVVTLAEDDISGGSTGRPNGAEPLRVVDWVGPDCGPYHFLFLGNSVPGNLMPSAPIQNLVDLHRSVNHILRKLIRQAERQKEVTVVGGGNTEDANRLTASSDGDAVRQDNSDAVQPKSWGGPNPQNFTLMGSLQQMFSWSAGNLDMLGGLSPQSKTATQDEMLNAAAGSLLAAMQERTVDHSRSVLEAMCWYWWNHPTKVMTSVWSPQGLPNDQITRKLYPASHQDPRALKRTGRLADMDVRVDPYSIQGQTPQSQAQSLDQMMTQIILPMMPFLQQQGVGVNIGYYLQNRGRLLGLYDLPEILTSVEPPPPQQDPKSGDWPISPAKTERTYNRVSQSNKTQENQMATMGRQMDGSMKPGEQNGTVNR